MRKNLHIAKLLAVVLGTAAIGRAADAAAYFIEGTLVTPQRVVKGKMVVKGDTIECVGRCDPPAGAVRVEVKDAFVYPGFIDAHQHMASNIAPVWNNTRKYPQRYEWQKDPDHLAFMAPVRKYFETEQGWCEAVRYAEIHQLVSGVTTIQGTGRDYACTSGLVRNADGMHDLPLPKTHVVQYIPDIRLFSLAIDWKVTRALAIHLGEGVDEYTRQELDVLEQKGLLRRETLIIHGTAFGPAEFKRMAAAGAKLVWSPQSNLALYGKSMDVEAAIRAGVEVSLGVDWSPSGSHDLLAELKVADRVNRETMHKVVKRDDWLPMITSRPARGLALDKYLGTLEPGKKADFTVLRKRARNPSQSLLKNELADVRMVWVGGKLLYGDEATVEAVRPGECERLTVGTVAKKLCVADPASAQPLGRMTFAELRDRIRASYPALIGLY